MKENSAGARCASLGTAAIGATLGGLLGGFVVVGVTVAIKAGMDFVAGQDTWLVILVPLIGLALTVLVLQVYGRCAAPDSTPGSWTHPWRTFAPGAIPADIAGDIKDTAGEEDRFPWRLAPLRTLAIFATVGLGGAMGTESPAAYLGVATGAFLGDRGRRWRRLMRPAALAGGAAGVAAVMGMALMGTAYMLELGRRHHAPLSAERVLAALLGGGIGWGINAAFHLQLIRLIVPKEGPGTFAQAAITAVFIGTFSGVISGLFASAIDHAKKWRASPAVRLALGCLGAAAAAVTLASIASPAAAAGPGGGAILWAENTGTVLPSTLFAVALLRAAATTAAVAAGGCGGLFVPYLAVGDIGGRVFAPTLGVGSDLAGAAGAASGIAGGYQLPLTAAAMTLGLKGPHWASLTCFATAAVAYVAGVGARSAVDRVRRR